MHVRGSSGEEEALVIDPKAVTTKDSGARAAFSNGGVRDTQEGKPRFDLIFPKNVPYEHQLITRLAALMARGAEKYDDRNWEQFSDIPARERAVASALRHIIQWANGEEDEDHGAAVVFNIMAAEYVDGVLAGNWKALEPPEAKDEEPELWEGPADGPPPPDHVVLLEWVNPEKRIFEMYSKYGVIRALDGYWYWGPYDPNNLKRREKGDFKWFGPSFAYKFKEVRV
jgi:hypothetical protein